MIERMLQEFIADRKPRARDAIFQKENGHAGDIFRLLGRTFDNLNMEFKICSTYAKESCLLKAGGQQYLLYDEYLTETLNALNLLYYRQAHAQDIEKYTCRLLADQFFAYGKYDAALYMIGEYAHRKTYAMDSKLDARLEGRAIGCAIIQQWFIIAHELGHWYIEGHDRQKQILSDKKDFPMELFLHGKQDSVKELFRQQISEKEDISEECFCDSTAAMLVLDALKGRYQAEQITEACFLAMEHIRILAGIETFSKIAPKDDSALQSSVRLAHMRFILSELTKDILGEQEGIRMFQRLGDIFKGYDRILYHPIMELLQSTRKNSSRYAAHHKNFLSRTEIEPILKELI